MSQNGYPKTSAQWEEYRHKITDLYLTQNKPLKEVQEIMRTRYDFRATKRMYTTRIAEWDIKKNYSAQEKDMIASRWMKAQTNPRTVCCTTFKGRDIKYQRIRRHVRSKRRERARENVVSPNVSVSSLDAHIGPAITNKAAPMLPCQATPSFRIIQHGGVNMPLRCPSFLGQTTPSEVMLHATRSFFEGILDPANSSYSMYFAGHKETSTQPNLGSGHMFNESRATEFWHDFHTAIYLLKIGSLSRGWAAFHAMWEAAAEALVSDPFSLLRRIITLSLPNYFGPFSELRLLVLRFIATFLEIKSDKLHPVVQICRSALVDDEAPHSCEAALALLRRLSEERRGFVHPDTFEAHLNLVVCQRRNNSLAVSEQSARELLRVTQSAAGEHNDRKTRVMRSLVHVLKERGNYEVAIGLCQQILGGEQGNLSQMYWKYTTEDLAELFRFQENFETESHHLYAALTTAQQFWGDHAAPTLHIQDKLRISLEDRCKAIKVIQMS